MNVKPLLVPKSILLPFNIICLVLLVLGALLKISHLIVWGITGNILLSFAVLGLFAWFIALLDIAKNKITNPFMWFIILILLGILGSLIYLINRDKIIIRSS